MAADGVRSAALWQCPKCRHRFTSRNLPHSCGNYRLADHFKRRPRAVRDVFNRWRDLARACGPVTVYAEKSRIVFQARVRFGGAIVHRDWIEGTLWLIRRAEHASLHRTESLGNQGYNLHFRLTQAGDCDRALQALVREAYSRSDPRLRT